MESKMIIEHPTSGQKINALPVFHLLSEFPDQDRSVGQEIRELRENVIEIVNRSQDENEVVDFSFEFTKVLIKMRELAESFDKIQNVN